MSPSSMAVLLILTLITGAATIYLYLSGVLLILPHALITAFSSGTASAMVLVFSLGAVGLLTAWVLAQQSNDL